MEKGARGAYRALSLERELSQLAAARVPCEPQRYSSVQDVFRVLRLGTSRAPLSPVTIRLGHRKRVRQMPDFMHFAVRQQHLDNIEPDFYRRIFQQAQIIQCGL